MKRIITEALNIFFIFALISILAKLGYKDADWLRYSIFWTIFCYLSRIIVKLNIMANCLTISDFTTEMYLETIILIGFTLIPIIIISLFICGVILNINNSLDYIADIIIFPYITGGVLYSTFYYAYSFLVKV